MLKDGEILKVILVLALLCVAEGYQCGMGSKKREKIVMMAMHRARIAATAGAGWSKDTVARFREQGVYKEQHVGIKGRSSQPTNAMMGTTGMEMDAVKTAKSSQGFCAE